jgi:hypothetical protein
MESTNSSRWFSAIINIAVILGLILVAFEINQTQRQMELSALSDGADDFVQAMQTLSQNEDLAVLVHKAETAFDQLDEFERWRVFKYLDRYLTMSEQDYQVIMRSDVSPNGFVRDWTLNMKMPVYQSYWAESQDRFSPEFQAFINGLVSRTAGR